ncbi:GrpB family protein [Rhizobium giardinii]|uniref:GrpB family protein n=1 Tax=Rhizobium giardinii TaxID=56731 RepID=UPI003D6EEA8A
MRKPVIIVPYDPAWPAIFVQIRDKVLAALGSTALAVEHIGSTSVPGLDAKPIIDIDVIISTETDLSTAISKLSKAGYTYEGEKGIEGRHAFAQPSRLPAHHLYVCAAGNPELRRHIAFRDFLRANPDTAKSYGVLNKCLAEKFGPDREGYTNAKEEFIAETLLNLSNNAL